MVAGPVRIAASATVKEAAAFLADKGVSVAPVIEAGRPVGVLSQSDIVMYDRETAPYGPANPEYCLRELQQEADEAICALAAERFYAVGLWYRDFSQTTDEEVHDLLAQARAERAPTQPERSGGPGAVPPPVAGAPAPAR
jgi:predicted phosphoribosyltransferase